MYDVARGIALDAAGPTGQPLAPELMELVETIARYAYRVTDEQFIAARGAGYTEDELFDVTVVAALGSGLARRERGLNAIEAWESGLGTRS